MFRRYQDGGLHEVGKAIRDFRSDSCTSQLKERHIPVLEQMHNTA